MAMHIEIEHEPAYPLGARLTAWLREHGIDPASLPGRSTIVIRRGRVTAEQYLRDPDSGQVVAGSDGHPTRTSLTVPLTRPYPIGEPQ